MKNHHHIHIFTILLVLFSAFVSCTSFSPAMKPSAKGPSAKTEEVINVIIKPITTEGFASEDEKQWGVDLSAYFSAFEVALTNNTLREISFEPLESYLVIEGNEKLHALDETAAERYYYEGDDPSRFVFIPKSEKKIARELKRIKDARLTGGILQPEQQRKGILFFKKLKRERCNKVILQLDGIRVVKTGKKKTMAFDFSCK